MIENLCLFAVGYEPLDEVCNFELAKSRLQIQRRKLCYSVTPNGGVRLWVNKTHTPGVTEAPVEDLLDLRSASILGKILLGDGRSNVSRW